MTLEAVLGFLAGLAVSWAWHLYRRRRARDNFDRALWYLQSAYRGLQSYKVRRGVLRWYVAQAALYLGRSLDAQPPDPQS